MPISEEQVRAGKQKILDLIRQTPELTAAAASVGILPGWRGLKVNLARPLEGDFAVPEAIDGIPVHVEVVGESSKLN
jgi:hypothetical protein